MPWPDGGRVACSRLFLLCANLNGVVMILGICVTGRMFFTSHAPWMTNHQYSLGSNAQRIQVLVMFTTFHQCLSTSPFWSWRLGGAACIFIFFASRYVRAIPDISLESKSVRMSFGVTPSWLINFWKDVNNKLLCNILSGWMMFVRVALKRKGYSSLLFHWR